MSRSIAECKAQEDKYQGFAAFNLEMEEWVWIEPGPRPKRTTHVVDKLDLDAFRLGRMVKGKATKLPVVFQSRYGPIAVLGRAGSIVGMCGIGKSMQVLDMPCAIGRAGLYGSDEPAPFGWRVPAEAGGAAIFITMEDDKDDIHRRMESLYPEGFPEGIPVTVIATIDVPEFQTTMVTAEARTAQLTEFASKGLQTAFEAHPEYDNRARIAKAAQTTLQGNIDWFEESFRQACEEIRGDQEAVEEAQIGLEELAEDVAASYGTLEPPEPLFSTDDDHLTAVRKLKAYKALDGEGDE